MPYEIDLPPKPHRGRLTEEEEKTYVEQLTDEQRSLYQQRKDERQTSLGGRRGPRPRSGGGLDDDVSVSELQEIIRYIFEALSSILRSDAEWSDEEFKTISKGLLVVINRVAQLKIVVRFLTPVSSVAQLVGKVRKMMNARKQETNNSS